MPDLLRARSILCGKQGRKCSAARTGSITSGLACICHKHRISENEEETFVAIVVPRDVYQKMLEGKGVGKIITKLKSYLHGRKLRMVMIKACQSLEMNLKNTFLCHYFYSVTWYIGYDEHEFYP